MLTERPLHPDVKDVLLSQEPVTYCHLVKFERPSRPDSNTGQVSTSKQRYTYITDASRDVEFDDGSVDLSGAANGVQTYIANKVLRVSPVQEDTEAKATTHSLILDGNGLGAVVQATVTVINVSSTVWDVTFPENINLLSYGFREGDKVVFAGQINGTVNISKFRGPNVIRVSKIDTVLPSAVGFATMSLASEEIVSILLDKNSDSYASFVNREVFIYRAYFQEGSIVGAPFLLFKGIISGVAFDDADTGLTVTWTLTSHWGDFGQVKGRITSDDFHRALDQNGVPQPQSALKVSYAYDKGFSHAETSINILAQYSVQVEKQDISTKKGFLGIGAKVKVKKYFATESRSTELDFQLQAKALPVIYGVRNTSGIPIFADTLKDDSSSVYVVHALTEGEAGGIYDVYIEGNSLICNDKADFDARSTQTDTDTVQLVCRGRADRGDVLGGVSSVASTVKQFYDTYYSAPGVPYAATLDYDLNTLYNYQEYVPPVVTRTDNTGSGVIDGQSISLSAPQEITLDFFSGKPGQKAASSLVTAAKANNFKIQNDYWNGIDTADYWGPNHRLLDTAYVVGKYKLKEGETSIPALEYIVRGKTIDCYNYDKSYSHYSKAEGENPDNFILGDFVDLRRENGTTLLSSVQIVDKWTFTGADGKPNTRFRFSVDPPLQYIGGVPSTTKFRMVKGSATWTMVTFNYVDYQGTVDKEFKATVTGGVNSGGYVQFNFSGDSDYISGGDPTEQSSAFSITDANGYAVSAPFFSNAVLLGAVTSTSLKTKYAWSAAGGSAGSLVGRSIIRRNVIKLPAGVNTSDGYYNGFVVTLVRLDPNTGKQTTQTRTIVDYAGSTRIATIDGLWDYGYHPKVGDTLRLTPAKLDSRISINPAMQLMDYICSPTYGRGLHYSRDLNFQSWLESARSCDEQSNVTVQYLESPTISPGAVYRYPATGPTIWQGNVVGTENNYVEFTSVLGKLAYAWNSWRTFKTNELVHVDFALYRVTSDGVIASKPTGPTSQLQSVANITLTKLSGTGANTISVRADGDPVRALKNGVNVPGYSLYDADGVDYWRHLGWDEFSQRYVTKHQTNIIIDTSLPLFDNVNSLLEHFNGILRYSNGQYYLEIEEPQGPISNEENEPRNITRDHIIGKIRLVDEGVRGAFNSLTASFADPANKFESRNVSFFNSEYLRADKNVPKKGNVTVPGITNYYNTRLLADQTLNRSRFGLQVAFNMSQRGTILLAGMVIQLQHPSYNWVDKKFRILSLSHQEDATVDIVAEEYDDSFYGLSNISKQAAAGLASNMGSLSGIGSPLSLTASSVDNGDETTSAVEIVWTNNPAANTKNVSTELYSSYASNLYVDVLSISGNTITTLQNPHQLKVGELITSLSTISGLSAGKTYYVKSTPAANTVQLSETKGGPILGLTDNPNVDSLLQTANLISTVAIPANSYVDAFGGIDNRVIKYYWVRHKVVQGV